MQYLQTVCGLTTSVLKALRHEARAFHVCFHEPRDTFVRLLHQRVKITPTGTCIFLVLVMLNSRSGNFTHLRILLCGASCQSLLCTVGAAAPKGEEGKSARILLLSLLAPFHHRPAGSEKGKESKSVMDV